MKKLFLTLKNRFISETPKFWKRFRNLVWTIASAAVGIWVVNNFFNLGLPEAIVTSCKYVIGMGGAMGFQAQLTKLDSNSAN